MDHFPKATHLRCPPVEIPFLEDYETFDKRGFVGFPERRGWGVKTKDRRFRPVDGSEKSDRQRAALIQAWLFFGLLNDVFEVSGIPVIPDDFVSRSEGGHAIVTTRELPRYLEEWMKVEREADSRTAGHRQVTVRGYLNHAVGFMRENFQAMKAPYFLDPPVCRAVSLSCWILQETLAHASRVIWAVPDNIRHGGSRLTLTPAPARTYLLEAGWCPSDIELALENLSEGMAYFASTLHRPVMKRLHPSCTSEECFAFNIDEKRYVTKHTSEGCLCRHVGVNVEEVCEVLRSKKVPRILISASPNDDGNSGIRLEVTDSGRFVAISHVWSHGLGNKRGNSLPECQLRRLQALASKLYTDGNPTGIWIDTLCIPCTWKQPSKIKFIGRLRGGTLGERGYPRKHEIHNLKKIAISRLNTTFKEADRVLVLDAEIEAATAVSSTVEMQIRVLCSTWARRLWTLQEAIAGYRRLYFNFLEGPIRFASFSGVYKRHPNPPTNGYSYNHPDLYCEYTNILLFRLPPKIIFDNAGADGLIQLPLTLRYRSTSKAEDEFKCIALLLGLQSLDIYSEKGNARLEEKMKGFIQELGCFPATILFSEGRRLKQDGYKWAPVSFLKDWKTNHTDLPLAKVTDSGLLVNGLDGFFLSFVKPMPPTVISVSFHGPGDDDCWYRFGMEDALIRKNAHKIVRPALLVHGGSATLVSVYKEEQGVIYADFIYASRICRENIDEETGAKVERFDFAEIQRLEKGYKYSIIAKAIRTTKQQSWCIK